MNEIKEVFDSDPCHTGTPRATHCWRLVMKWIRPVASMGMISSGAGCGWWRWRWIERK
jgi:hypothetical protein